MNVREKISSNTPKREHPATNTQRSEFSPSTNSPIDQILYLQQTIGNRAVQRLIKSGALQAKLKIGKPNDKYEKEADRVAEKVMMMPEPHVLRQHKEEETVVTPAIESSVNSLKGSGQPLPNSMRNYFEPRFSRDFSSVRVHKDGNAARLANSLDAWVFTSPSPAQVGTKNAGTALPIKTRRFFEDRRSRDFSGVRIHADSESVAATRQLGAKAYTHRHTIGNHAVKKLFQSGALQPKSNIRQMFKSLHSAERGPATSFGRSPLAHSKIPMVQLHVPQQRVYIQRKEDKAEQAKRLKAANDEALATAKRETKVPTAEAHWAKGLKTSTITDLSKVDAYLDAAIVDLEAGVKKLNEAKNKLRDAIRQIKQCKDTAKKLRAGGVGELSAIIPFEKARTSIDDAKNHINVSKPKGIAGLDPWLKKITDLYAKLTKAKSTFWATKKINLTLLKSLSDAIKELSSKFTMEVNNTFKSFPITAKRAQFVLRYFLALNVTGYSKAPTLKAATGIRTKLGAIDSDLALIFGGKTKDYKLFSNFEDQLRHQIFVRSEIKKALGKEPGLRPSKSNVEKWFKKLKTASNTSVIDAYRHLAGGFFIHRGEPNPSVVAAKQTLSSIFTRPTTITGARLIVCSGYAVMGKSLLQKAGAKFINYYIGIRASDSQIKCSTTYDDVHAVAHLTRTDPTTKHTHKGPSKSNILHIYVSNDDIVFSKNNALGLAAVAWDKKTNPIYEGTGRTINKATTAATIKMKARQKSLGAIKCPVP